MMIVKVMYMVKRDSFYGHNVPMISLGEANQDTINTRMKIFNHTPDLGLCYYCRKLIVAEFTYLIEGDNYLLLFCKNECEDGFAKRQR